MRIKDLSTRVAALLSGSAWFCVDNGSKVEKVAYSEIVKQGIENYTGTSLAGSNQSVKSAVDALNSKTGITFTHDTSLVSTNGLFIKRCGNIVIFNGYLTLVNATATNALIGTIPDAQAPDFPVRVPAIIAVNAYDPGTPCYLLISTSGEVRLTLPSGNTNKNVYFTASYAVK